MLTKQKSNERMNKKAMNKKARSWKRAGAFARTRRRGSKAPILAAYGLRKSTPRFQNN